MALLEEDVVDVALCSSIDLIRSSVPLMVVPVGMLGCDGPTLTVRLFSSVPFPEIRTVHCDCESHTSVELLKIVMREAHGFEPEIITFDQRALPEGDAVPSDAEAVLLIGDKVVTSTMPESFSSRQWDLGEAWHDMTGMPFVFATWLCRVERTEEELERIRHVARILEETRRRNADRLQEIAELRASEHGWSVDLAGRYLSEYLRFDLDERALAGLHRFLELSGASKEHVRQLEWI